MLGFLGERRAWLVAVVVVLLLVAGIFVWGSARATTQAAALIRDRFGLETTIEEASVSFGGLELSGVEMLGSHGGLVVRMERVHVQMSLLAALFQGAQAVRRISARGVDVLVDFRHEGLSTSVELLKDRIAPASRTATSKLVSEPVRSEREYEILGLNVRAVDADGPLVLLRNVSVEKKSIEIHGSIEETMVGVSEADYAHVGPAELELRRMEDGWKLRELSIDGANVRSVRRGDGPKRALAVRIREAVAVLRSASPVEPVPGPADALGSSAAGSSTSAPAPARMFARLAPGADIMVSDVQVESRMSANRVERLRDFALRLQGDERGRYRVTLSGQTTRKGMLRVDLSIMPAEARAEGSVALREISLALVAPFLPDFPLHDPEAGTLDAELDLVAQSPDRMHIEGRLELRELALSSERIAPEPVEQIDLEVTGQGVWYAEERRLAVERGEIRLGRAQMLIEGELEHTPDHYRVDLTAKVPPTRCNDVLGAIPDDLLGSLVGFEWSGNWSALGRISLDSRELEATELSIRVRNLCQFEQAPRWVRVEQFQEPFRHRVIEPDETVFEIRTGPGTEIWVALADISPFVVPAMISHEDGAFYEHGGFAPWAIRDALVRNLQEGRYVVGASTISMQLAKNLYLQRDKNIARKVQEVILTWWLENALTKDEILELYVNVIEYGPGVYGLRYAAAYYFGREPHELSPAESAFLACMLPSPKRYHVSYERGALTRSMKSRMGRLLEHMAKRERIGPEALAYGLAELDDFRFHRVGDPVPPPRTLPPLGAPDATDPEALDPFEALFLAP